MKFHWSVENDGTITLIVQDGSRFEFWHGSQVENVIALECGYHNAVSGTKKEIENLLPPVDD